jgi:hypothetical protein
MPYGTEVLQKLGPMLRNALMGAESAPLMDKLMRLGLIFGVTSTGLDQFGKYKDRQLQQAGIDMQGRQSDVSSQASLMLQKMLMDSNDKMYERMASTRKEDKSDERRMQMLMMAMAGKQQDNQLQMGLIQAMMQNSQPYIRPPQEYGPPTSLISLLR